MKYICVCISTLILLLNSSCIKNEVSDSLIVAVDLSKVEDRVLASTFIDSIYTFKLELPEPYVWGNIGSVLFTEDRTFIFDKSQNLLFAFSADGVFLGLIGRAGNGPGEYVRISSCFLGDNYIYINDAIGRAIHAYTWEGEFTGKTLLPGDVIFTDITALSDSTFLCYGCDDYNFKENNGVWVMNDKGERVQKIFTFDGLYPKLTSDWKEIQQLDDDLIFYYMPSSTYYHMNLKTLEVEELLRQRADLKMLSDHKENKKILEMDRDYTTCSYFYYASDWLFTMWVLPDNLQVKFALYSSESGKNVVFDQIEVDIPGYNFVSFPFNSNLENKLLQVFTNEYSTSLLPDQYQNELMDERTAIFQISVLKKIDSFFEVICDE